LQLYLLTHLPILLSTMEQKKIPCAIIGLGRIASTLEDDRLREKPATHAGAIEENPETILVAGYDSDKSAREAFVQRWNIQRVYDDLPKMLEETQPQILHIATHEDSHLKYLKMAIDKSIPVVILEKPVSDNLPQAKAMLNRLKSTRVLVNHERRYSRDYLQVKEHIEKETYGRLMSITGRLYMGMNQPIKNILLHDGTHMLDIMSFLTGKKLRDIKVQTKGQHNLYATALSGDTAILCEVGNQRNHLVFELELSFSQGRIRVGNGIYEEWESLESPYYEKMKSLVKKNLPFLGPTEYFKGMMKDAVGLVKNPQGKAVSSFEDGVQSLLLIEKLRSKCK
jgi:predicted dehydrogenase